MDSTGTVEVGGPAGCLHGDFSRDLTNASGQAQHSLAQGGHVGTVSTCYRVTHRIWTLGWPLIFTSFLMWFFFFPLSVLIVGLWRMPSAVCQSWGNVRRSNNASVLCSVKWWKRPVITGIIKTVRGSSMDGFVYCLLLSQHHKLLGLRFLSLGLRHQKIIATVTVCVSNNVKVRVMRWVVLKSHIWGTTLTVLSAYMFKAPKAAVWLYFLS